MPPSIRSEGELSNLKHEGHEFCNGIKRTSEAIVLGKFRYYVVAFQSVKQFQSFLVKVIFFSEFTHMHACMNKVSYKTFEHKAFVLSLLIR